MTVRRRFIVYEPQFRLKIEGRSGCASSYKDNITRVRATRDTFIADYMESWHTSVPSCSADPNSFVLVFLDAEIIDRQPPPPRPGVVELRARATAGTPRASAALTIGLLQYPEPPSGCDFHRPLGPTLAYPTT